MKTNLNTLKRNNHIQQIKIMENENRIDKIIESLKKKHKINHDIKLIYPQTLIVKKELIINRILDNITIIHKQHSEMIQEHKNLMRKLSFFCQKEFKRVTLKTGKTNPLLKSKKIRINLLKTHKFLMKPSRIMKKDLQNIKVDIENQYKIEADNKLNELIEKSMSYTQQVKNIETKKVSEIPQSLKAKLSNYQIIGFQWLKKLYSHGLNGILADDMGLGKTIQSLALLAWISEKNMKSPFLIVTPSCTLNNWSSEIKKFLPSFQIIEYWSERRIKLAKLNKNNKLTKPTVLIMSYTICVQDIEILKKIKFAYVIIDEAQSIKNYNSKRWKALKEIKTLGDNKNNRIKANLDELKQFAVKFDDRNNLNHHTGKESPIVGGKLLLSGTPIQNNLTELWALLNFIMPSIFHSAETFLEWFMKNENKKSFELYSKATIDKLKTILDPFMLRREKKDILNELPSKTTKDIYLDLTKRQSFVYNQITKGIYDFPDLHETYTMNEEDEIDGKKNVQMHLRKVCNHLDLLEYVIEPPMLILKYGTSTKFKNNILSLGNKLNILRHFKCLKENRQQILKEILQKKEEKTNSVVTKNEISRKEYILTKESIFNRMSLFKGGIKNIDVIPTNFVNDSCKLSYLANLLPTLKAQGHKCLIYFQMTRMITIFESFLNNFGILTKNIEYKNFKYLRLDGTDSTNSRKSLVDEFSENEDIFIFLLSTRAASVGLNLVAADTVIFYDSDWNPTVDMQAEDRVHRIGQMRPVTIYKLKVRNSIEEQIEKTGILKRELMQDVLKSS